MLRSSEPGFGNWRWRLADDALEVDPQGRQLLGLPPDAVLTGPDWLSRLTPAANDRFDVAWASLLCGLSRELDVLFELVVPGKATRWVRVMGVTNPGGDREPASVRGIVVQMSEQCSRESQHREAEARFRVLIEHAPEAIAVHREGRVVYANPALGRLLARPPEQLVGEHLLSLTPREARTHLAMALLPQPDAQPVELQLVAADGRRVVVEALSTELPYEDAPGTCTLLRDVTARKATDERLAQAERMATVGRLAAGVAHEVNNPLMYVLLAVQGLLEEVPALEDRVTRLRARLASLLGPEVTATLWRDLDLQDDSHPFGDMLARLQEAENGATRVRDIVQDLRAFSRPEDGPPRPVAPRAVVEAAVHMTEHFVRHRGAVTVEVDESAVAMAVAGRLTQVLVNLIVNAADALDDAAPEQGAIRVSCRRAGPEVIYEVSDNGRGIPPQVRPHIFEPFFTTKEPGKGTGLGLAVCDGLIRSYGGRIDVETELGRGTTFRIALPLAESPAKETLVPPPAPAPLPLRPAAPDARVLLVDDEVLMGRSIVRALRNDARVVTVAGGADAIAVLQRDQAFDLVLCDMMMPGVNGAQLHAWIGRHVPELLERMVFITGDATTEEARAFLSRVPNRCLIKPVPLETLRALAREVIPRSERRSAGERRRAPRQEAHGATAMLSFATRVVPVTIVDWSEGGLRARPLAPAPDCGPGDVAEALLCRPGEPPVHAGVTLRRRHGPGESADLCVEFSEMGAHARATLSAWLGRSAAA